MTIACFVVLLTGYPIQKRGVLMTGEEMKATQVEMLKLGQMARSSQHPMFVAGVLLGLYRRRAQDNVEREALAYVFSLLVESSAARPGSK
jgi:hypothetical protein